MNESATSHEASTPSLCLVSGDPKTVEVIIPLDARCGGPGILGLAFSRRLKASTSLDTPGAWLGLHTGGKTHIDRPQKHLVTDQSMQDTVRGFQFEFDPWVSMLMFSSWKLTNSKQILQQVLHHRCMPIWLLGVVIQ